jgi:hypothetical protein
MSKFHYATKLLCKWLVDERLMYYSWHLVMLESRIVAMLFGVMNEKLAS